MAKADSLTPEIAHGPDFTHEDRARASGCKVVAGVDEAGRGPLAGPVVAAAVVLDPLTVPEGINDSKKLTAETRQALFSAIMASAHVSVAVAPPSVIDRLNIRGATLWAMRHAVMGLCCAPDHVLVDGNVIPPGLPCEAGFVIGGDALSLSIAAASIIAKVTRDSMCPVMDCDHPGYDFGQHKGYSTPMHLDALMRNGPTVHHRRSFGPVAQAWLDIAI